MNPQLKLAAVLISCFAAFLVAEAVGYAVVQGRLEPHHFAAHILGAMVWFLVARGLLRGHRWAWLAVVVFGGTMSLLLAASLLVVVLRGQPLGPLAQDLETRLGLGGLGLPLGGFSLLALVGSVLLLLSKQGRAVFSPRSQRGGQP